MSNRILIVTHHFPPEIIGGATRISELAYFLSKKYNVIVVCPLPTFPFGKFPVKKSLIKREYFSKRIQVFRLWNYQPITSKPSVGQRILFYIVFSLISMFFVVLLSKLYRVKYIITTTPPLTTLPSGFFTRFLGVRWIIDIRDLWIDAAISLGFVKKESILTKLSKFFEKISFEQCNSIITNSRTIKKYIEQKISKKKEEIVHHIPLTIDLNLFRPTTNTTRRKQVIYTGNLGPAQDLKKLIYAFSYLSEKARKEIILTIVGNGEEEQELKNLARELKIPNVNFIESISRKNIPNLLSQASIGIVALANNSSLFYALPTKTLEYMACGLPIISYGPSLEVKELIKESKAGIHIQTGAPKDIAQAIEYLMYHQELLEQMSKNGRNFIKEKFNRKKLINTINEIFQ